LHQKTILAPTVLPTQDASRVADNLTDETEDQSNIESGASASYDPSDDESDQRSGKYGKERSIRSEVDAVLIVPRYIFTILRLWVLEAEVKKAALVNPCLIVKIWNGRRHDV
jgi:hypothetical protein